MKHFQKGHPTPITWPLTADELAKLGPTSLVSPVAGIPHGCCHLGDDEFRAELEVVERVRDWVASSRWPGWFFENQGIDGKLSPLLESALGLSESDPQGCADVVKMDHPFDLWDRVIEPFATSNKIALRDAPKHKGVPFVETVGARSIAHSIIADALEKCFEVKYFFGQARPFEISNYGGSLEQYPCPAHPERPAGHGAFCGATNAAFRRLFVPITDDDLATVKTATLQFAHFRTFSAMHLASSNNLGWEIGNAIV